MLEVAWLKTLAPQTQEALILASSKISTKYRGKALTFSSIEDIVGEIAGIAELCSHVPNQQVRIVQGMTRIWLNPRIGKPVKLNAKEATHFVQKAGPVFILYKVSGPEVQFCRWHERLDVLVR